MHDRSPGKKALQLLWFVIPFILLWIGIFIVAAKLGEGSTPVFAGGWRYLQLLTKDFSTLFAFINTVIVPCLILFGLGVVLYIVLIVCRKRFPALLYSLLLLLGTLIGVFCLRSANVFSWLLYAQGAVLVLLLFWVIDLIVDLIVGAAGSARRAAKGQR